MYQTFCLFTVLFIIQTDLILLCLLFVSETFTTPSSFPLQLEVEKAECVHVNISTKPKIQIRDRDMVATALLSQNEATIAFENIPSLYQANAKFDAFMYCDMDEKQYNISLTTSTPLNSASMLIGAEFEQSSLSGPDPTVSATFGTTAELLPKNKNSLAGVTATIPINKSIKKLHIDAYIDSDRLMGHFQMHPLKEKPSVSIDVLTKLCSHTYIGGSKILTNRPAFTFLHKRKECETQVWGNIDGDIHAKLKSGPLFGILETNLKHHSLRCGLGVHVEA